MPRADVVAPPGCPSLRALSFDNLGLIKVIESSRENGHPQVVARWGEPSSQRSIVSVSLSSDEDCEQVLAVARRNFNVEILNPSSGALCSEVNVRTANGLGNSPKASEGKESAALIGVHPFRAEASGLRSVLTCTDAGIASLQWCNMQVVDCEHSHDDSTAASWAVCKMGSILCMKVDGSEKYAAFGGDGAEIASYDIQSQSRIWEAKAPRRDNNGLMSRPFVTALTFLRNDHRKLVIGTGHHQVRLYDIGARRRPMMAFDFMESPIKAVEADTDGNTVFVGTGNGDLASFDMRTGKLLGSFKGKVSGSIRSIAVHPSLPIIATCGLDRFLRVFHKSTRQLLSRVFLKQPLVATVFDTQYPIKLPAVTNGAERPSGKTILVAEQERDGQRSLVKKCKKSPHIEGTEDEENSIENGAENSLPTAGKIHKRRKSKKRRLGEPLKVSKRKKGDSSTMDSVFEQVQEENQMRLKKECVEPVELSLCKRKEEPVTKLRKTKKLKRKV